MLGPSLPLTPVGGIADRGALRFLILDIGPRGTARALLRLIAKRVAQAARALDRRHRGPMAPAFWRPPNIGWERRKWHWR